MRKFAWLSPTALALAAFFAVAPCAHAITTIDMPERFLIARAPAGMAAGPPSATSTTSTNTTPTKQTSNSVEKPAAAGINGTNGYTVVAPILTGQNGTISYIRLFNGQTIAETTNVIVVGSPSGNIYGAAQITVPVYASPQYEITDIFTAAGVGPLTGGDTAYVLYLQDPSNAGNNGFQHVYYNNNNGFFENASVCTYVANEDYSGENQVLINVHTTDLPLYPAQIEIINYNDAAASYTVTITDARTGQVMGQVVVNLQANAVYSVPFGYFEQVIGWTPNTNQEHANMFFQPQTGQTYQAIVSQMILNTQFGSYVNMSHFCAINHVQQASN